MISQPSRQKSSRLVLLAITAVILFLYTVYRNASPPIGSPASYDKHRDPAWAGEDLSVQWNHDPIPRRQFSAFTSLPPQNTRDTSGNAYAAVYCTRDADARDPFFNALQSVIWRILYGPMRSKYPIIVYVCPWTTEEQRTILKGQGVILKDVKPFVFPEKKEFAFERWQDVFTKLEVWADMEYKKLVFLDVDAFPVTNTDEIFTITETRQCKRALLTDEDRTLLDKHGGDCSYTFAAVDPFATQELNAGMMVLSPSKFMHARLVRNAARTSEYDFARLEQALLSSPLGFSLSSAFPVQWLKPVWNVHTAQDEGSFYERWRDNAAVRKESGPIRIHHQKFWKEGQLEVNHFPELGLRWDADWMSMCRFYDSDRFVDVRLAGWMKDDGTYWDEAVAKDKEVQRKKAEREKEKARAG